MKIMSKRATLPPKDLWDVTVMLSHDLKDLNHKWAHTHTRDVHTLSLKCINQA